MGPLVMTGLATFGASMGIGLLMSGTYPTSEPIDGSVPTSRGLAIVLMAFCTGLGVLGVVVGLLAVMLAATIGPNDSLLAAVPAVAGALVGVAMIVRNRPSLNAALVPISISFIVAMAMLGVMVPVIATSLGDPGTKHPIDGPFGILGLVSLIASLAIGRTGATAVRSMNGASEEVRRSISGRQIARSGIFQATGVVVTVIAIVMIVRI
ncbi:MAG: hypothetical protein ABI573_12150 [Chloroflexota bacterium]